ncbi:serine/threonine-protein kinase [Microbulbifer sp. 2205BS26-8]|uniref:serine/threonine-protein kinase n=1 Tax=Microbulbifer sp. 2205BS26-8 TaxID=3064386 RepID=UPI00273D2F2E|nr:serine/threonine-protein kinase [Microbulbifer sp. 2205BS26-8]MDP5209807.1 protein kinase [Microbulbifer sp. 2205BS26-8]
MDVVALEKTEVYQGRYSVEGTLGAGGMGVIYLAKDVKLGRKVAIKQLRSDLKGDSAEARFHREAQLLARLNHSNIVRLYDVLEDGTRTALVMELVEGVTLREWMREHAASLGEKLDLLMQICKGLGKAHSLGIIHRDLKPENILVTNDGIAKITDFGIAKALDCDQQLTREDHIAGSVQAMSPEQVQGAPVDARSDLFSLGSIAFELLCDKKPFERGDLCALAFAQQITSKPHIPPQQAWPEIPKTLAALLDHLLSKRPEQRPDSVQQVYEALELVGKHGITADTQKYSETVTQLLVKPRKKGRRIAAHLAIISSILGVGIFWAWQTFMQLPPQYIAILPVQLSGEISAQGEKNVKPLFTAMVRQALTNATAQLKSSALVSHTPSTTITIEEQIQKLNSRGITDALLAQLNCIELRCNIELQRINVNNQQIVKQISFPVLSDSGQTQQAQHTITNNTAALFPEDYRKKPTTEMKMDAVDYNHYLKLLSKLSQNDNLQEDDLDFLEELIAKYPRNTNTYRTYAEVAASIYNATNNSKVLTSTLGILSSAEGSGTDEVALLEAKLRIKSYGADRQGFESILSKLQSKGYPSAYILAEFARFQYLQGNYSDGLAYAKQAANLRPTPHNTYLVAINQLATANYDSARSTLQKLNKQWPEYWPAFSALGAIELELGNITLAEQAITTIPKNIRTWRTKSNLGTVFFLQGKYSQALGVYQEVLQNSPNNIAITFHMAEVYLMQGNKAKANEYFNQVIVLTNENSSLNNWQHRALALAYLGNTASSVALAMKLLREVPEHTYTKYTAVQVYALAGEWQSANYYLEQLLSQGMSPEWFNLPAFQLICAQPQTSQAVLNTMCR